MKGRLFEEGDFAHGRVYDENDPDFFYTSTTTRPREPFHFDLLSEVRHV